MHAMELFASRAMERFRCIGPECEDSCCHDEWGITYDEAHFDKLAARMTSAGEQQELIAAFRLNRDKSDPSRHAIMVMKSDGKCSMLDSSGWCKIHQRYGEEYLSNICSSYPRVVGRLGERKEVLGIISCPEVVRLTMLSEDGLQLVRSDATPFGRGVPHRELDPTDQYRRSFFQVRSLLGALLRHDALPIASRLFAVAFFAQQTRDVLRADANGWRSEMVLGPLEALRSVELLDKLHEQLVTIDVTVPFALSVVRDLLTCKKDTVSPAFTALVEDVKRVYQQAGVTLDADTDDDALLATWRGLRPTLGARVAARLETLVERYAQDYVQRVWFVRQPSLLYYVFGLFVRLATIRFVLLSHPLLQAHGGRDDDEMVKQLDDLFVRVVYSLSRTIDHDTDEIDRILKLLEANHFDQLEHALCLIKL